MSELTLNDYATGLMMCAARVKAIAEEVAEHVAADNLDGASLVLGTQDGKMAELEGAWNDLHKRLVDGGANWERALGRGGE